MVTKDKAGAGPGASYPNHLVFVSVVSADTELRDAALRDGYVVPYAYRQLPDANGLEVTYEGAVGNDEFYEGSASQGDTDFEKDAAPKIGHTDAMSTSESDKYREHLDRLEDRLERRVEQNQASYEARFENFLKEQETRDKLYAERYEFVARRLDDRDRAIDSKLDAVSTKLQSVADKVDGFSGSLTNTLREVKTSNRNTGFAILAIAAAAVVGLWGANATILGSAKGFLDEGRAQVTNDESVRKLIEDAKAQSEANQRLLDHIIKQQQQN